MIGKLFKLIPRGRISYSQEGEDLILSRIFENLGIKKGFFVDVGAHHPYRFSNTYYFYRRGWTGINIDPIPGTKKIFDLLRSRDINIECGVSDKNDSLTYYTFNEPALNTFSLSEANSKVSDKYKLLNKNKVPVQTLKKILDENLPNEKKIDFISIDVEGYDYEVICSNDWTKYRPTIVAIELLNTSIDNIKNHSTAKILFDHNYQFFSKTNNTFIFSHLI